MYQESPGSNNCCRHVVPCLFKITFVRPLTFPDDFLNGRSYQFSTSRFVSDGTKVEVSIHACIYIIFFEKCMYIYIFFF